MSIDPVPYCCIFFRIFLNTVFSRIVSVETILFWKWKMRKFLFSFRVMAIFYFINWTVAAETICGNTVHRWELLSHHIFCCFAFFLTLKKTYQVRAINFNLVFSTFCFYIPWKHDGRLTLMYEGYSSFSTSKISKVHYALTAYREPCFFFLRNHWDTNIHQIQLWTLPSVRISFTICYLGNVHTWRQICEVSI